MTAEEKSEVEKLIFQRLFRELGLPENLKPNPLIEEVPKV
jgi:hypothetical protein